MKPFTDKHFSEGQLSIDLKQLNNQRKICRKSSLKRQLSAALTAKIGSSKKKREKNLSRYNEIRSPAKKGFPVVHVNDF